MVTLPCLPAASLCSGPVCSSQEIPITDCHWSFNAVFRCYHRSQPGCVFILTTSNPPVGAASRFLETKGKPAMRNCFKYPPKHASWWKIRRSWQGRGSWPMSTVCGSPGRCPVALDGLPWSLGTRMGGIPVTASVGYLPKITWEIGRLCLLDACFSVPSYTHFFFMTMETVLSANWNVSRT